MPLTDGVSTQIVKQASQNLHIINICTMYGHVPKERTVVSTAQVTRGNKDRAVKHTRVGFT